MTQKYRHVLNNFVSFLVLKNSHVPQFSYSMPPKRITERLSTNDADRAVIIFVFRGDDHKNCLNLFLKNDFIDDVRKT